MPTTQSLPYKINQRIATQIAETGAAIDPTDFRLSASDALVTFNDGPFCRFRWVLIGANLTAHILPAAPDDLSILGGKASCNVEDPHDVDDLVNTIEQTIRWGLVTANLAPSSIGPTDVDVKRSLAHVASFKIVGDTRDTSARWRTHLDTLMSNPWRRDHVSAPSPSVRTPAMTDIVKKARDYSVNYVREAAIDLLVDIASTYDRQSPFRTIITTEIAEPSRKSRAAWKHQTELGFLMEPPDFSMRY